MIFRNPINGKQLFEFSFSPENVDKSKPSRKNIRAQLEAYRKRRVKENVKEWRDALSRAEDPYTPDRVQLNRVFRDIILDPHLASVMQTRKLNVMGKPHHVILTSDGSESEELTELFKTDWFRTFMDKALDSIFWGYTMIELGDIVEDAFTEVMEVPRDYVIPEKMGFVVHPLHKSDVKRIDEPPYKDWVIFVGSQTDFGLLNKAAAPTIWKRASFGSWAEYNEVFGIPIMKGSTTAQDPKVKQDFEEMMANMHKMRYGLFDPEQDDLEVIEPSGGSYPTFLDTIETANSEISKVILGQTMTSENGSSRSQGEVHERIMRGYEESDMHFLQTVVNQELIPRMQKFGILPEGVSWEWNEQEQLNLTEQWEIDKVLVQSREYEVDPEYIAEKYGTPVQRKSAPQNPQEQAEAELMNIENVAYTEYPSQAVRNAEKALKFIRTARRRGSKKARQIARRLTKREPIGKWTLREVTSYAVNEKDADKPFEESEASLNFALVGGRPMVRDYAPQKLQEIKNQESVVSSTMKAVEKMYGNRHDEGR